MTRGRTIVLVTVLLVLVVIPGPAAADGICRLGTRSSSATGAVTEYGVTDIGAHGFVHFHVQLSVDVLGAAQAHGVIVFLTPDGAEVFTANPDSATANCADRNGNGVAGLTMAAIAFSDVRAARTIAVLVVPEAGEIDEDGWHPVIIRINEMSVAGVAHASLPR